MLPRIKEVKPMPDYCLRVVFDDGRKVLYDVKEDIDQIESYRDLETIHGLFNQVHRFSLIRAVPVCTGTMKLTCRAIRCMSTGRQSRPSHRREEFPAFFNAI